MYDIILSKSAAKYLDKLNKKDRERIIKALEKLRFRPDSFLKKLVGKDNYRLRVGNYRLIIDLKRNKLIVLVLKIGHRKNIYK